MPTDFSSATVLDGEKDSLALHVELCARRNSEMLRKQEEAEKRLKRIEMGVYAVGAIVLGAAGVGVREILPLLQAAATIAGAVAGTPPPVIPGG